MAPGPHSRYRRPSQEARPGPAPPGSLVLEDKQAPRPIRSRSCRKSAISREARKCAGLEGTEPVHPRNSPLDQGLGGAHSGAAPAPSAPYAASHQARGAWPLRICGPCGSGGFESHHVMGPSFDGALGGGCGLSPTNGGRPFHPRPACPRSQIRDG